MPKIRLNLIVEEETAIRLSEMTGGWADRGAIVDKMVADHYRADKRDSENFYNIMGALENRVRRLEAAIYSVSEVDDES